jgi:transcriptional regulator of acetoin/glycerol metabolism
MSLTYAVLDQAPSSESMPTELAVANKRIAELEGELRRLREAGVHVPGTALTDMRLLEVEGFLVKQAMDRFRGNISRAARALGLSRSALYRRLERHELRTKN